MCGAQSIHEAGDKCGKDFIGNREGGQPPGRPRHKWENKSEMNCKEIGWEDGKL